MTIKTDYPSPLKGEFTKITTPDGKLAYIAKHNPDHDAVVAQICEEWSLEEVRPDIQAATKEDCMAIRVDS